MAEQQTVFISPTNRVRIVVEGDEQLDGQDAEWLRWHFQNPSHINEAIIINRGAAVPVVRHYLRGEG